MRRSKVLFLVMAGLILLSQCATYEDGGSIKKASDNILGTFNFSTYIRNGVDETNTVLVTNYSESYLEGGTLNREYTDDEGQNESESGRWTFNEDNTAISISDVSSIGEWSAEHSTLSTSSVTVLRLNETELWYQFENGGDTHEFRFLKE